MNKTWGLLWRVAVALLGLGAIAALAAGVVWRAAGGASQWHVVPFSFRSQRVVNPQPSPPPVERVEAVDPQPEAAAGQTYTVKPNEDLYAVAIRFGVSPGDLKELNKLPSSVLEEGMVLKIPERAKPPVSPDETPDLADAPAAEPEVSAGQVRRHIVKRDEDVYAIAIRYGVSPRDLKGANNLSSSDLSPGMVLEIPECAE